MNSEGIIMIICMIVLFFVENMMFTPKMFLFILISFAATNLSTKYEVKNKYLYNESFNT